MSSETPPLEGSGTTLPEPPRRRGRLIALAAVAIVVIVAAVLVALHGRKKPAPVATGSDAPKDGSAAIRAPEGPALPGAPETGVRLSGFVLDGAGMPVAGAEVTAEIEQGAADKALAPAPKGQDAGVSSPADAGAVLKTHVAPPTGADGRFVVGGLEPGRYRVRVTGTGLLPAEVRFVPVPSDATRIVVSRQVGIEGRVTDGGKPVPGVSVGVRGDAIGGELDAKTDDKGHFAFANLPEGRFQLFAWQGALAARAVRVNRLGAGPFPPIELPLVPATVVVGRVIDRDEGTGVVAAIELRPSGDDQAPRYARSGDDGTFKIEGVPNGKWIADAFSPGYLSPGGIELEAGRGIPEIALARGATIEGHVLDADGKPIAGATVRALSSGANPVEQSAAVDQDKLRRFSGRMQVAVAAAPGALGTDPAFIPRGELGVTVGPIPPLPPPGAQTSLAASIEPGTTGMAGEPAALAIDPARASVWTTGADGAYRIRGVARGKITVLAAAPGYAEGRSKELSLDAGQTVSKVDVTLSPGTFIIGKVTDQHAAPVIGAQVSLRPELGAPLDAFTDEEGGFRLGPITGKAQLHATAYGHGEASRALDLAPVKGATAGEQREDLVLEVADSSIAGTLDDTSGAPVAAATLEVIGGAADGRTAVVGADGTFSLDQLPSGKLVLRVRHPDYPPHDFEVIAGDGRERVRLRIPLGGAVSGAVIDASSAEPLANLTLTATGPGGAISEATTDKGGRFKLGPLAPGTWKLDARAPGYIQQHEDLEITAGRTPGDITRRDLRLELQRGATLGGTVRDARGQRVSGATVSVKNGTGISVDGTSDNLGEFHLQDCPAGEVVVTATSGELSGLTRVTVRPGDEILSLAIEIR